MFCVCVCFNVSFLFCFLCFHNGFLVCMHIYGFVQGFFVFERIGWLAGWLAGSAGGVKIQNQCFCFLKVVLCVAWFLLFFVLCKGFLMFLYILLAV